MLTVDFRRLDLRPQHAALDVGCGRGRHLHALAYAKARHCVGLDADAGDVNAARDGFNELPGVTGWSVLVGDARAMPFDSGAFDRVICSEVLEHIVDYEITLDEIARVTAPGGVFAMSVPRAWPEAICWRLADGYAKTPGGHVRIFNARQLRADIEARGFVLRARHGAHALHSPYWWLKCLVWERRDDHPLVRVYQRFLEWDILKQPRLTRALERLLNPVLGKSVVMYFERSQGA